MGWPGCFAAVTSPGPRMALLNQISICRENSPSRSGELPVLMQRACRLTTSTLWFPQSFLRDLFRGRLGWRKAGFGLVGLDGTRHHLLCQSVWLEPMRPSYWSCRAPPDTVSATCTSVSHRHPCHSEQARWHCPRPGGPPPFTLLHLSHPSLPHPIGNPQLFCQRLD